MISFGGVGVRLELRTQYVGVKCACPYSGITALRLSLKNIREYILTN